MNNSENELKDHQGAPLSDQARVDHQEETQPSSTMNWREDSRTFKPNTGNLQKKPKKVKGCCSCGLILLIFIISAISVYFLFPERITVLLMGIDTREQDSNLGRTDTLILTKFQPSITNPDVALLSIPRDLWVDIPGIGENRINTAHFFAENQQPGTGPQATIETVEINFDVNIHYFTRIRFEGIKSLVDVLGGVDLNFPQPVSGYSAGTHHLNGEQVLAFVRDRQNSDDFFRMEHGQLFLKAILRKFLTPSIWLKTPQSILAIRNAVDTNIPIWQLPRILYTLLRVGPENINSYSISREMVQPFTTEGGAQVLSPNWELIKPLVSEMLGK